jgi:cytochrome c5
MGLKILVVVTMSLLAVSCGSSDDMANQTIAGKDVADTQAITQTETPAAVEAVAIDEKVVATSGSATPVQTDDKTAAGEAVYKKACVSCHMTGAAGAPKLSDASAWAARIEKGPAALVQSAMTGVPGTAMMARGACGACSDADIKAAVDYMIAQSR